MQTATVSEEPSKSIPPGAVQPAQGGWLKPFQKGQTGNPGGRTKAYAECQALARERSVEAMGHLCRLMASDDERVALMAADKVLERAWGKPKEQKEEAKAPLDLSKVPPEALQLIKQALAMIAMSTPAPRADIPDAEIIPNDTPK